LEDFPIQTCSNLGFPYLPQRGFFSLIQNRTGSCYVEYLQNVVISGATLQHWKKPELSKQTQAIDTELVSIYTRAGTVQKQ